MAMGETTITIVGNLTTDPELKFTQSGAPLARFTIASTPRTYDRQSGQYKDGTAMFMRCSAWRHLAEHVADSVTKGMRVIATGRLRQFDWETEQGEKRSMLTLEIDDIGPSLTFATATVQKATAGNKNGGSSPTAGNDPWNTAAPASSGDSKFSDAPPF